MEQLFSNEEYGNDGVAPERNKEEQFAQSL